MKRNECCQDRNSFRFFAAGLQGRAMNFSHYQFLSHKNFEGPASVAAARSRVPSWKRMLDIICVLAGSILWVPAWLVTGIFIKIVSPGPIIFKQERVGHRGRLFRCLKFRTMAVNADICVHQKHLNQLMTSNQPMKKLDSTGDPRLIPGGLWLRSLGVDELPQLINILRGEMSLVGPRPCVPYEYEMFLPHHRQRCDTLPGLTGLWQVNGKNRTTFEKMMELDLSYVEKKSLFLDVKIIVCTVPAVLLQVWDAKTGRKSAPVRPNRQLVHQSSSA
jgi:exopolysaccharide production protein ExoY